MGWQRLRLDELGTVARGKSRHRPRNDPSLYDGKWPFFQTGDVKAAELYLRAFSQTYNDAGLAQSKLWPADTLCITIAANIAETAILAIPGCFPDSIVGFRADPARSDVRYVKYLIDTVKLGMQNASRGTTQDNLSLDKLLSFQLLVPPVTEQRRIASILSAYDDLIENNTRRIAILEEMARRIYEEWFVHFRFPGHEHARMVESELGSVPEGWRVAPLSTIATRVGKSMNPSAEPDELFEHFSLPAFDASHRPVVEVGSGIMSNKLELASGVVLLSKLNPRIKRIWIVSGKQTCRRVCSTEFLPYEAKSPLTPYFLFLLLDSDRFQSRYVGGAVGTSTSHQRVKPADVDKIDVLVPHANHLGKFDRLVAPMLRLADTLRLSNTNLRTTRDLLLPKLISGELDVSALPEAEAVAA